jgi:hypothetical protein
MKALPENWHLVEEWDDNFIFENNDASFSVDVSFTEQCINPYSISFTQLKGIFTVIGFENGAYSTHAITKEEALEKAVNMMLFIDKFNKDKIVLVQ